MMRESRFVERPSLRMALLLILSAVLHLTIIVELSGRLGAGEGVSRLSHIICVSLVPRAGPRFSKSPEAFKLVEQERDKMQFDVSAQPNVPDNIDEIYIDRLRKARVSISDPSHDPEHSTRHEERLLHDIPDTTSSLNLAQGSMSNQGGKSFLHSPPDGPPQILRCSTEYPELALRRGFEGVVELNIEVLADGSVGDVYLEKTSGHEILDEAALRQVKHCKFTPAYESRRAITTRKIIPWRFELSSSSHAF
jgi:TonB family protein